MLQKLFCLCVYACLCLFLIIKIKKMSQKTEEKLFEEWEAVRCPICMEPPHEAILLLCSSHQKGCRAYICDNSQSNCFGRFTRSLIINEQYPSKKLVCPLCRGEVSDWTTDEPARRFMNNKPRSCTNESCEFLGTYIEILEHKNLVHTRVSQVDPQMLQKLSALKDCVNQIESARREGDDNLRRLILGSRS
ncbi:putative transcription factor C2H2 family [Helianthus debilis subsp. tardiflorus]